MKMIYYFKDRSLILGLESFIQKRISMPTKASNFTHHRVTRSTTNILLNPRITKKPSINKNIIKENNYKEKIVFSSEQYCSKCQCYNSFDFDSTILIHQNKYLYHQYYFQSLLIHYLNFVA